MIVTLVVLIVPAAATYEIQNGTFGSLNGNQQDYASYIHIYGGLTSINGIYFTKIEEYPAFNALKITTTQNDEMYRYNTTSNSSSESAYLTDSTGRIISTGIFGFNQYENNLGWYIYYFANSWDIYELTGPQYLILHYDNSKFDVGCFWYSLSTSLTGAMDIGFTQGLQIPTVPRITAPYYIAKYFYTIEYTDNFVNLWHLYKDTPSSLYYRIYIAKVFDYTYPSRIQVNITVSGTNSTVFDRYSNTNEFIEGLHPLNLPYYIDIWAKNNTYHESIKLTDTVTTGEATWDLNVRVYDASTGGLYAGSRVDKTDNTDPTLNGWDINTDGISIFQVITGHNYTFTASATGMISDSDYYDAVPTITTLILTLRKDLGSTASYAEFLVVDNQSRRINGASVYLSDGQGLTTRNGYALFNITTGLNYGYEVSKTAFDTQNGNFTAVAGSNYKLIVLYPAGTGATGQPIETSITITDPREAARQSMEMGYTLIPSFFMLALVVLLMAMLGFNPADMGKRRGGKR